MGSVLTAQQTNIIRDICDIQHDSLVSLIGKYHKGEAPFYKPEFEDPEEDFMMNMINNSMVESLEAEFVYLIDIYNKPGLILVTDRSLVSMLYFILNLSAEELSNKYSSHSLEDVATLLATLIRDNSINSLN